MVPGSAFVIARTAHRNNTSNYFVDGRRSNFGEVTALLKGKGVDLDNNRFLILQGEVEQISMMKPKGASEHETGLLEYLEDIVGTDRFIPLLEDSSKRCARVCVQGGGQRLGSEAVTGAVCWGGGTSNQAR